MGKIIIEKLKDKKIFLMFLNLLDISSEFVRNKITSIVDVFSKKIIVKIVSRRFDIIECAKEYANESIIFSKNKNDKIILFKVDTVYLENLLEIVSRTEDSSMELYTFDEDVKKELSTKIDEAKANFYMYITDNDGVTVIFDSTKYEYKSTLEKLKNIYN